VIPQFSKIKFSNKTLATYSLLVIPRLGSGAGPVIQGTGKSEFEDGLGTVSTWMGDRLMGLCSSYHQGKS
jgi:hypothetical protein